jgi:hypothetical protein
VAYNSLTKLPQFPPSHAVWISHHGNPLAGAPAKKSSMPSLLRSPRGGGGGGGPTAAGGGGDRTSAMRSSSDAEAPGAKEPAAHPVLCVTTPTLGLVC